jgi:hypothetical protein
MPRAAGVLVSGVCALLLTAGAAHAMSGSGPAGAAADRAELSLAMTMQPPPAAQDEFVPVSELPPEDRLPAAPLLVGAYAFVWVMLLGYLVMIWRRVGKVEAEMASLARRLGEPRRD